MSNSLGICAVVKHFLYCSKGEWSRGVVLFSLSKKTLRHYHHFCDICRWTNIAYNAYCGWNWGDSDKPRLCYCRSCQVLSRFSFMLTKQQAAEYLGVTVRTLFALHPGGEDRWTLWARTNPLGIGLWRVGVADIQNWARDKALINQQLTKVRQTPTVMKRHCRGLAMFPNRLLCLTDWIAWWMC